MLYTVTDQDLTFLVSESGSENSKKQKQYTDKHRGNRGQVKHRGNRGQVSTEVIEDRLSTEVIGWVSTEVIEDR